MKAKKPQIEQVMATLRTDLVTERSTRPKGPHDKKPPHEVIVKAVTREVEKCLRGYDLPDDRLGVVMQEEVARWNHYLTFAFAKKNVDHDYYLAHKQDIDHVVEAVQSGTLKNHLDRQLIWRMQKIPPLKLKDAPDDSLQGRLAPLARDYLDLAISHNARFILGTIGKCMHRPGVDEDLDASDYAPEVIDDMRNKIIETYDPVQTAITTFMTKPIKWAVSKMIKGKAQDRFDRSVRGGVGNGADEDSDSAKTLDAVTPEDRTGADGMAFLDPELKARLMTRLRAAGEQLVGDRARMVFAYKLKHPVTTLQQVAEACDCTRENVRQGLADVGRQMERIDPDLAAYIQAMLRRDEAGMDEARLDRKYDPSPLQVETEELIDEVVADICFLKKRIGTQYIQERGDELMVSKEILRGNKTMQKSQAELMATHRALKNLQLIVDSPFVDAGFDVLPMRDLQALAFYPGGSKELESFIEFHIEDIAEALRAKALIECKTRPKRLEELKQLVDRFYDATNDELEKFGARDFTALFCAPEGTKGDVLDRDDLLMIRELGVEFARKRDCPAVSA